MDLNKDIDLVRINKDNYLDFSKLLEWRRNGEEQGEFPGYKDEKLKNFLKEYNILNSDMFYIFAAKKDNKFVAYINAVLIPKPDPRLGLLYVDELWTAPPYRKRGIAERLMNEVFKLGKELDLWRIRLDVSEKNHVARKLYKKVGFSESDVCMFSEKSVDTIE